MKKSKSTSIINITSFAYKDGWVGEAAFAAGASSVCHMTRPLAMQLKNHGIRVNTIAYNWLQDTTGDYTFREIHNFLIRERNRNACDGFLNHLANKNIETTNQKNEPFMSDFDTWQNPLPRISKSNPFDLITTHDAIAQTIELIMKNEYINGEVIQELETV